MKQNIIFSDELQFAGQMAELIASLKKIQQGLLLGLGSIITIAIFAIDSPQPTFVGSMSIFLWIMLFLIPAAVGIVMLKFPSWQKVPLALRKNAILQSFGLSLITLSTIVLFHVQWNPSDVGFIGSILFVTMCYGAVIVWLAFRLQRRVDNEESDLFP